MTTYTKTQMAAIGAGVAAAALIGFASPAAAAPSDTGSVGDTISALEEQGHTVIVNNLGGGPLDQASVVSVRQGPEHVDGYRDASDAWVEEVTQSIVFVDVR